MAKAHYVVAPSDGRWFVILNDIRHGPYSSQEAAVLAASAAGHKAEAMGYDVSLDIRSEETPSSGSEAA